MPLPINLKDLLSSHMVVWDRLELQESWNPEETIHSLDQLGTKSVLGRRQVSWLLKLLKVINLRKKIRGYGHRDRTKLMHQVGPKIGAKSFP